MVLTNVPNPMSSVYIMCVESHVLLTFRAFVTFSASEFIIWEPITPWDQNICIFARKHTFKAYEKYATMCVNVTKIALQQNSVKQYWQTLCVLVGLFFGVV